MTEKQNLVVVDNLHAPDVFSDGALSFFLHNGVVRITFTSARTPQTASAPEPAQVVVIGRLMLTIPAAQELAIGLNGFLEKQGLSPTEAVRGGATAQ